MAKKKKSAADESGEPTTETRTEAEQTAAFEAALREFAAAVDLLRGGEPAEARDRLAVLIEAWPHEPELAARARTYICICEQKLAPPPEPPQTLQEQYLEAVFLSNDGRWDEAIGLLNGALKESPTSVECLYARASAWALKGRPEPAIADLQQAIAVDPTVRFQAVNDPDFEPIREEPAFIDIIEPTPSGA